MACRLCGAKSLSEQCWLILTGPLGTYLSEILKAIFIQEKSIENVYKTEAILSRSQCINNNNNVVHSNHSGLIINDGGLWTVAI